MKSILFTLFLTALHSLSLAQEAKLELYATTQQAVGNIAYAHDGSLVFSHHPFFKPEIRVAHYDAKTKSVQPFPNKQWNTPNKQNDHYLDDILGIRNDSKGIIWILDMGTRSNITPKLVGWNTKTNKLHKILYIPAPATNQHSQPNDFVIDESRQLIVIADEGIGRGGDGSQAALITVDMTTGETRRLLAGHPTTAPDKTMPILIGDKPLSVTKEGKVIPIFVGADGITLDKNNHYLYYCPLNGDKIYRVPMDKIANPTLTEKQLSDSIETHSSKVNNGGLSIDTADNLYFTNVESHSIGYVSGKDKTYTTLASDPRMLWPDGLSYNSTDGYIYVSAAQVHLGGVFNNGNNKAKAPFYIFRFKPTAKGIPGR